MAQDVTGEIPKAYNPEAVEGRVYDFWMGKGYFTPRIDPEKKPFVVVMPPPNVTGELHLGHALTASIEDILCRWHRMLGEPTLWLPGKDHAGIATQWVVEQQLSRRASAVRSWDGRSSSNACGSGSAPTETLLTSNTSAWVCPATGPALASPGPRPQQGRTHHLCQPLQEGADLQR